MPLIALRLFFLLASASLCSAASFFCRFAGLPLHQKWLRPQTRHVCLVFFGLSIGDVRVLHRSSFALVASFSRVVN